MRFSGFSFRLGKRTRLYFSNPKTPASKTTNSTTTQKEQRPPHITVGGVALRLVVLFIMLNNVDSCYLRGDVLPFVLSIVWSLAAAAWLAWYLISTRRAREAWEDARHPQPVVAQPAIEPETPAEPKTPAEEWQEELDDMAKAEKLQAQLDAEAAARAPKYKTVPILLELDMSSEHQQALRDLKLKIATRGLHGDLTLQQDDNLITVLANDFVLGKVSTADALWIDRCFSYIDKLTSFEIVGGGRDIHGAAIPFMVIVDLSIHSTAPGVPDNRSFDLPSAEWVWGTRPDAVCYISRTGTAHHQLGS